MVNEVEEIAQNTCKIKKSQEKLKIKIFLRRKIKKYKKSQTIEILKLKSKILEIKHSLDGAEWK